MSGVYSDCNGLVQWVHTQSNANRYGVSYSDGNSDSHSNADRYGYGDADAETDGYSTAGADTAALPNASAASVGPALLQDQRPIARPQVSSS